MKKKISAGLFLSSFVHMYRYIAVSSKIALGKKNKMIFFHYCSVTFVVSSKRITA